MLKRLMVLSLAAVVAGKAEAQNQAVIAVQPNAYEVPACEPFRSGHFKVKSGATYVQSALGSASNRARLLGDADRVLREAIAEGQNQSPMAWYWLGRVYLYRGDVAGADSSFAKARQLAPECAEDLRKIMQPTAGALMQPARMLADSGKADSAMVYLRQAASFYPEYPTVYYEMAVIYYNRKQSDSAAVNFEKAAAMAEGRAASDSAFASFRAQATFNAAAAYQTAGRHKEAVEALRRYLTMVPNDPDARRALATSFRAIGMPDSAQAIESQLIASGMSAGTGARTAEIDAFNKGLDAYTAKNYKEAARIFTEVLKDNPYFYDAVLSLAKSYLQIYTVDSTAPARERTVAADSLISVGERLIAIDPMNENSIILIARGHQIKRNPEQTLKYISLQRGLPVTVEITAFRVTGDSATISATTTGRVARDDQEKVIPPSPVTLVIEFLDVKGAVIGSQEVTLKALNEAETQEITAAAQGAGIAAWRYKRK